jgi:hypothetical protein
MEAQEVESELTKRDGRCWSRQQVGWTVRRMKVNGLGRIES